MVKGDAVVVINEDGTEDDKGFYYLDEFVNDGGKRIIVLGGLAEGQLFMEENEIRPKTTTESQLMLNVMVDIAASVKYLTERIEMLIPKCPECNGDMCCGPKPECNEDYDNEEDDKLN